MDAQGSQSENRSSIILFLVKCKHIMTERQKRVRFFVVLRKAREEILS